MIEGGASDAATPGRRLLLTLIDERGLSFPGDTFLQYQNLLI